MATKKFILAEKDIPQAWYNVIADMPNKPMSPLNPATKSPLAVEDLYPIFAEELCKQELNTSDAWIEIPEEVRDMYKIWRPTPLVRALGLEKALATPAHIYFKNESVSPVGSHKLNSAIPQAYYCKKQGITNITTETGAGQWGAALSLAAKAFGLELAVYMVKVSFHQKPYRRSIMQTFGAQVIASPSMSTKAGRKILTDHPNYQGSLGTAISEAIELAMSTPNCKYTLGSVLNHVSLHQTVIGLEAEKQMEMAGEYPDIVIACFGGGSNFSGISFPFLRHKLKEGKDIRLIAAEPASCPKLTKGIFQYDFGDEAGYTPLLPMYTLGHNFSPVYGDTFAQCRIVAYFHGRIFSLKFQVLRNRRDNRSREYFAVFANTRTFQNSNVGTYLCPFADDYIFIYGYEWFDYYVIRNLCVGMNVC